MKQFVFSFWVLFCALLTVCEAAEDPVWVIRRLYTRTSEAIDRARGNQEGERLYCNVVEINSLSGSWRAVGTYRKKITFWYRDQPEFARYENRSPESVLVKVEVRETSATRTGYHEILFDEGRPVFHFSRDSGEGKPPEEERRYFSESRLILLVKGATPVSEKPDPYPQFQEAEHYRNLFLAMFP